MKKKVCRVIGFLLILAMVMLKVNDVVAFKYTDGVTQMEQFYKQEKGSVDVLVLGSSHAFVNVNPAMLEEEFGIWAYDLCGSMQPMWNTYYYFKEALKYQKPQLVVLDVYRLVEAFPYSKESKIVKNTYGMRFSRNKYESIKESLSQEDMGNVWLYMVEFPLYHSRYVDLTAADFNRDLLLEEDYRGAHPVTEVAAMVRPELSHVTQEMEIEPKTLEYFEKILALASENELPVLLINAPYIVQEDDRKVFNTLESYLKSQNIHENIAYVDFNEKYDEMGIDFATDFADYNHLNVNGIPKFNHALGTYIKENYDITDHREE